MDADKIPLTPELLALHDMLTGGPNPYCAREKMCAEGCQYPQPCDAQAVPPPTRHGAPAAPHGVRDLLLALAALPVLGALLDLLF